MIISQQKRWLIIITLQPFCAAGGGMGISVKNISKAVKNTAWDILNFTQENAKTAFFQSGFIRYII